MNLRKKLRRWLPFVAALAAAGGAAKKHAPDLKAIEENAKAAAKALLDDVTWWAKATKAARA